MLKKKSGYSRALNSRGKLLSIDNVKDGLEGMILTREGVYLWQGVEVIKNILGNDDDVTEEELNSIIQGYTGEYVRAISLENYLYEWFKTNKFDGELMEIMHKDFLDETVLHVQVKMYTNLIWRYDYKISLDIEGNVKVKENMLIDQDVYDKKIGMGKYEIKIENLESNERETFKI